MMDVSRYRGVAVEHLHACLGECLISIRTGTAGPQLASRRSSDSSLFVMHGRLHTSKELAE